MKDSYTVITGANGGIGRALLNTFAQNGYKNFIISGRDVTKLKEVKVSLESKFKDINIISLICDLTHEDEVIKLYEKTKAYKVSCWVNNAGVGLMAPIYDTTKLDRVLSMIKLNIDSLTILSSLYLDDYKDDSSATLINVSSATGYDLKIPIGTYSATKTYVAAFTEMLYYTCKEQNFPIRVKVLAPSGTKTEFFNSSAKDTAMEPHLEEYASKMVWKTPEELATGAYELFMSDKCVGKVNYKTNEFELSDPIFNRM